MEPDAIGLAELVARREVTPAELLDQARARAEAVNPRINAIVHWIDGPPAAGDGPFAGVPFLLKDLVQSVAGVPTSNGCKALVGVPAPETTTVVQRWLDAGLQVFGKTNTPEFGAKGVTEPEAFGPCRNPWNLDHTPGGSSGGAAAAVAAGIIPCAGASDGGGSIRIPAACCGLFGLKVGRGLIPSGPALGEALFGSGLQGVISRSVRDSAGMLDVLAGPDPAAPYAPAMPTGPFAAELGQDPGRLRIGVQVVNAINPSPDREARAAVEAAVAALEAHGHHLEEVAAPCDDAALARDFLASWFVNSAMLIGRIRAATGAGDEGFEQDTLLTGAIGRATSSVDFCAAVERRQDHVRAIAAFHRDYDLLLTPTLATPPPRIGAFDTPAALRTAGQVILRTHTGGLLPRLGMVDQMIDKNLSWIPYTQMANLTGRPAMTVPLHWTADGLPLGVQFVADLGGEGTLLRLAAQLEESHPWAQRRPELPH